jgi:integrase
MIHAGVILKRRPEGYEDLIVRYLDEEEAQAFDAEEVPARAKQLGADQYYRSQVTDQDLRQAAQSKVFVGADRRHREENPAVAARHVEDVFRRAGLSVDPFSDLFEQSTGTMLRAHRDALEAITARDAAGWRPRLDADPAEALVTSLTPPPTTATLTPPKAKTRRAALKFSKAAREAIPEISRRENFKPKRVPDYEKAVSTFIDWRGYDPELGDVSPEDAGEYNAALGRYPARASVRRQYRDLATFAERRALSVELNDDEVLAAETINTKYLAPLRQIYHWQRQAGSGLDNPFAGIASSKPRRRDPDDERRDFSLTELKRLFALPMFVGAKGPKYMPLYKPGPVRISDYRFWLPLICLFSGLRLNEACGLAVADIKSEGGILYFHVRDEMEGQSVKAPASRRRVPLHHQLLELGLPEHVERMKANGSDRLFPELRLDASGYYSDTPSKFFATVIARIIDSEHDEPGNLVFHSTRHTATSRLRAADVRKDVSEQIIGHKPTDTHSGYGKFDIPTLKVAVDKIAFSGLDLSALRFPEAGTEQAGT